MSDTCDEDSRRASSLPNGGMAVARVGSTILFERSGSLRPACG